MKIRIKRELKNLVIMLAVYFSASLILSLIFKTEMFTSMFFVALISMILSNIIFRTLLGKNDD